MSLCLKQGRLSNHKMFLNKANSTTLNIHRGSPTHILMMLAFIAMLCRAHFVLSTSRVTVPMKHITGWKNFEFNSMGREIHSMKNREGLFLTNSVNGLKHQLHLQHQSMYSRRIPILFVDPSHTFSSLYSKRYLKRSGDERVRQYSWENPLQRLNKKQSIHDSIFQTKSQKDQRPGLYLSLWSNEGRSNIKNQDGVSSDASMIQPLSSPFSSTSVKENSTSIASFFSLFTAGSVDGKTQGAAMNAVDMVLNQNNGTDSLMGDQRQFLQFEEPMNDSIHTLRLTLQPYCHRPLGCTVEESLAPPVAGSILVSDDSSVRNRDVFISKVIPDSFADQAGLKVGDVVIGVTSIFGGRNQPLHFLVNDEGIEQVKRLVASCPDSEVLQFQIVRGTTVVEEHERALVDVISNPEYYNSEEHSQQALLNYLKESYVDTSSFSRNTKPESTLRNGVGSTTDSYIDENDANYLNYLDDVNEADSLLDSMYSMWASDTDDYMSGSMPGNSKSTAETLDKSVSSAQQKPWSSRSSPSGTFVRDPTTGKMKNIDTSST